MVVVSGQKFVEELKNADDDVLSFAEGIAEVCIRVIGNHGYDDLMELRT
jgi:hypothetical protein